MSVTQRLCRSGLKKRDRWLRGASGRVLGVKTYDPQNIALLLYTREVRLIPSPGDLRTK